MGHHRRKAPTGGLVGWLIHWWHRDEAPAQEANRKALAALSDAKAQQPGLRQVDDFVSRVSRELRRRP